MSEPVLAPKEDVVMPPSEQAMSLPEPQRQELFLALVDAQDHDLTVEQSRKLVAERFGVSEHQVRAIEREGLDNGWPPL